MGMTEGRLIFQVQGSVFDPYVVTFTKLGNQLRATCTCEAGHKGTYCKHRLNILSGNTIHMVNTNEEDVKTLVSWIPGTDLEQALNDVRTEEENVVLAKAKLNKAHKRLASVMYGRKSS